jgi:hypothetical protein
MARGFAVELAEYFPSIYIRREGQLFTGQAVEKAGQFSASQAPECSA